jgi:hypothetical protein
MIDQDAVKMVNPFEGPIAGQSLTSSPESSQAWEQAPDFAGIKDATNAIFLNLLEDEMLETVVTLMANGTSIGDITKMLLMSGLSNGKFNPDLMVMLIEPVMYMLLAIAEKIGIKNPKLYDGEEDDEELDQEESMAMDDELKSEQMQVRNPERFSQLKITKVGGGSPVGKEIMEKLDNIDVPRLQSLMEKPQQPVVEEESLMARR